MEENIKDEIIELYNEILIKCESIEIKRKNLLNDLNFEPFLYFKYIDQFNQGYITNHDLDRFFKNLNFNIPIEDIEYLFIYRNYHNTINEKLFRKDVLYYDNFLNLLKSYKEKLLPNCLKKNINMNIGLKNHSLNSLVELFYEIIYLFKNMEIMKSNIIEKYPDYYNKSLVLMKLDKNDKKFVKIDHFLNLFENSNYSLNKKTFKIFNFENNFWYKNKLKHKNSIKIEILKILISPLILNKDKDIKRLDLNNNRDNILNEYLKNNNIKLINNTNYNKNLIQNNNLYEDLKLDSIYKSKSKFEKYFSHQINNLYNDNLINLIEDKLSNTETRENFDKNGNKFTNYKLIYDFMDN